MSSLRSDRAKRRASRLRNTRIILIIVLLTILLAAAYFLWNRQSPAEASFISERACVVVSAAQMLVTSHPSTANWVYTPI